MFKVFSKGGKSSMVSETSILALKNLKPKLNHMQNLVLNGLRTLELANNKMIAEYLNLSINQVTGRMVELRDKFKFVTFSHKGPCPYTSQLTDFWKLTINGLENSQLINNVKTSRLVYREYVIEEGFDVTCYKCCSRDIMSKEWHKVEIFVSPLGETRVICDCYDFNNTLQRKTDCKHIADLKIKLRRDNEI
jgi:hypothetical protein